MILGLMLLLSACATIGASPFVPTFPKVPAGMPWATTHEVCQELVGDWSCKVMSNDYWDQLMAEREHLYRELKAACRALGHGPRLCSPTSKGRN